jgi:PPM family protein phosphatase
MVFPDAMPLLPRVYNTKLITDTRSIVELKERLSSWLARSARPNSSTEIPELAASIATTVGEVRTDNQDRALIARINDRSPSGPLFVAALCDGMGGLVEGDKCAELALASFLSALVENPRADLPNRVRAAFQVANRDVHRVYRERGGTTLVALVTSQQSGFAASVGDSRVYSLEPTKALAQITVDDTIGRELEAIAGADRNYGGLESFAGQLTQFIGMSEPIQVKLHKITNDRAYLLSSDGVHSIAQKTFEQLCLAAASPHAVVSRLIQVSRWCGGRDNATAVCVTLTRGFPVEDRSLGLEVWATSGKFELPLQLINETDRAYPPNVPRPEPSRSASSSPRKTPRRKKGESKGAPRKEKVPRSNLQIELSERSSETPKTDAGNASERATEGTVPSREETHTPKD